MQVSLYQPHDLLWVKDIVIHQENPNWYANHIITRPVVVRRAKDHPLIPVGVRGSQKTQRLACWVNRQDIIKSISAIEVVKRQLWLSQYAQHPLQQFKVLQKIELIFSQLNLSWGLCGSLGFELATGLMVANENSDIDLIVYMADKPQNEKLVLLWQMLQKLPFKADLQIETPIGAIALYEWMNKPEKIMVKTNLGPILCTDPWSAITKV
ncbi:phosphoribosyl-dephospho-CoA transferase [Psychromonas ingrahamii 37]|uniref:Phosphoribosyl-dephospho-CoA transferase n=1 Tax=Psychromonas ingrahamii (strain DSM 17664 / CCUG 51855 / 37) TaxID=357804 RepID=A1T0S3_PSYIN|nr:malonate decarboxylase holo-ACP synthase [Psychromonas ingrahamii]ABM05338.1 phosphoribosyl-dephospho-CoA transferase [Psychromonas ingrahamii 37]